ncbi:hypothetical protein KBC75_00340 [Candidatus Shapirobacteria bacterium]|nr:hypothetical protein [Candidatus Shapirobacteria bacterium]
MKKLIEGQNIGEKKPNPAFESQIERLTFWGNVELERFDFVDEKYLQGLFLSSHYQLLDEDGSEIISSLKGERLFSFLKDTTKNQWPTEVVDLAENPSGDLVEFLSSENIGDEEYERIIKVSQIMATRAYEKVDKTTPQENRLIDNGVSVADMVIQVMNAGIENKNMLPMTNGSWRNTIIDLVSSEELEAYTRNLNYVDGILDNRDWYKDMGIDLLKKSLTEELSGSPLQKTKELIEILTIRPRAITDCAKELIHTTIRYSQNAKLMMGMLVKYADLAQQDIDGTMKIPNYWHMSQLFKYTNNKIESGLAIPMEPDQGQSWEETVIKNMKNPNRFREVLEKWRKRDDLSVEQASVDLFLDGAIRDDLSVNSYLNIFNNPGLITKLIPTLEASVNYSLGANNLARKILHVAEAGQRFKEKINAGLKVEVVVLKDNKETIKIGLDLGKVKGNLTKTIDGATNRNRQGEWLSVTPNGRVHLAVGEHTPGGKLLNNALVWKEIGQRINMKLRILPIGKSSTTRYLMDIPQNGELVVSKPPQEWRFRLSE